MPNEDTMIFSKRMNIAMAERHIKQFELARITGISSANINRYIKGLYMPKARFINQIAKALQVNPDWLIGATDDMELVDPTSEELKKKILLHVEAMSKEQKEKTLKFIEDYIM